MIASPQNEKLKLVRKLRERKHREREGLFVTEGEDLLEAGLAAGAEPRFLLTAAGSRARRRGGRAGAAGRRSRRSARARGRSPSGRSAGRRPGEPPCLYLHGVADPGNVGAIVRTAARPARRHGRPRARLRRPVLAEGGRGRAWARSSPSRRRGPGSRRRRAPRAALVAHGGEGLEALAGAATALPRRRARGPARRRSSRECDVEVTIPLRAGGAESLNVAAAAAIACERLSSPAMSEAQPDA